MNIFAISKTPDFFIAKFNSYESQKIYLFELSLLFGLCLNIAYNYKNEFKIKDHYLYILIIFNPYLTLLQKTITAGVIMFLNQKNIDLIFRGIKHGIIFNIIPAIYQLIFQKSIGLSKIGESLLSTDLSQIAKIEISNHKFIRSYGLLAHPNILAFISLMNPKINNKLKDFINLITLSGSNTLALYLKKLKNKKYLNISLIILILILLIKGQNSLSERFNQIIINNSHHNFQPIHNLILEPINSKNWGLLYGLIMLTISNINKTYFLIPILLLDHFIISSFACFTVLILYLKSMDIKTNTVKLKKIII
mgnify:FL=1|jgi:hypothetical protein